MFSKDYIHGLKAGSQSLFHLSVPGSVDNKYSILMEIKGKVLVRLVRHRIPRTWHIVGTNKTYLYE